MDHLTIMWAPILGHKLPTTFSWPLHGLTPDRSKYRLKQSNLPHWEPSGEWCFDKSKIHKKLYWICYFKYCYKPHWQPVRPLKWSIIVLDDTIWVPDPQEGRFFFFFFFCFFSKEQFLHQQTKGLWQPDNMAKLSAAKQSWYTNDQSQERRSEWAQIRKFLNSNSLFSSSQINYDASFSFIHYFIYFNDIWPRSLFH